MKRTRLIATLAAVFALALTLAACGGSNSNTAATDDAATAGSEVVENAGSAATPQAGEAVVKINTEGMGVISWAYENEEIEFDEDMPFQSAFVSDAYGQTIHIEARDYDEYEGWHFTKWTKDGADFSTDNRIDVMVDGDVEYIAVFEFTE